MKMDSNDSILQEDGSFIEVHSLSEAFSFDLISIRSNNSKLDKNLTLDYETNLSLDFSSIRSRESRSHFEQEVETDLEPEADLESITNEDLTYKESELRLILGKKAQKNARRQ